MLKSTPTTEMIPVIIITAFPSEEVKKQVMKMGAKEFILKPYNGDVLIDKINAIIN